MIARQHNNCRRHSQQCGVPHENRHSCQKQHPDELDTLFLELDRKEFKPVLEYCYASAS
jgi:hypothetical protein